MTLDDIDKRLEQIERNQELTMRMVQLILGELGLRKQIKELAEEMETGNGSNAPPPVGRE